MDGVTLWDDVFDLENNLRRRAGKRLDARRRRLLTVAADRYAKELEKLPVQRSQFGDVGLQ